MTQICVLYLISILLTIIPLAHIVKTQQFNRYFVYFVTTASFLILNLAGTISPNILSRYHETGYYFVFVCMSIGFNILYWFMQIWNKGKQDNNKGYLINAKLTMSYIKSCLSVSVIGIILFSIFVTPPLFLRFDLYDDIGIIPQNTYPNSYLQHKNEIKFFENYTVHPDASSQYMLSDAPLITSNNNLKSQYNSKVVLNDLNELNDDQFILNPKLNLLGASGKMIEERMAITTFRSFHWFVLFAFELPLFLVILVSAIYSFVLYDNQSINIIRKWQSTLIKLIIYAGIISLWILSKQYLVYLISAYFLVILIFKNKIDIKCVFYLFIILIVSLGILYAFYAGSFSEKIIRLLWPTLCHRVLEVYPWASAIAYNLFPEYIPFLHGTSMINLFHWFNFAPVSVANLIYPMIYGYPNGSAPLPSIFESYANWGWIGIILTEIIIVFTILGVTVLSWSRDIWTFSLSCYLTIKLILFWQAPLWYGVFEPTLVFFILLIWGFYKLFIKFTSKSLLSK